jgi:hypothetical protein
MEDQVRWIWCWDVICVCLGRNGTYQKNFDVSHYWSPKLGYSFLYLQVTCPGWEIWWIYRVHSILQDGFYVVLFIERIKSLRCCGKHLNFMKTACGWTKLACKIAKVMRIACVWLGEVAYEFWKTWQLCNCREVQLFLWSDDIDGIDLNALGWTQSLFDYVGK